MSQTSEDLFKTLWGQREAQKEQENVSSGMPEESPEVEPTEEVGLSPSDILGELDNTEQSESESEDSDLAAADASDESETGLPSIQPTMNNKDSEQQQSSPDIEELFVKGTEGRKQKLKIDYSDRKAIKQAFIKAAGMRKFQAERDATNQTYQSLKQEHDSLKSDFEELASAFDKHGVKGIVELLGGEDGWKKAVDDELVHRDYVNNLTAEEKYQLEIKKRDELYQKQLTDEKTKREAFQKQVEERELQAEQRALESKLHPAFDRYRFAGKLGDTSTENLYDEAIWSKVQARLNEYPDTVELSQSIIDKEFRTVANMFRKHIKSQTEQQVKNTVEKKKMESTQRAQVAAKKGLSGSTNQRKMLESLRNGDFSSALNLWKTGS